MRLSIVMAYYRNPGMLAVQYGIWKDYPEHLKGKVEVVLVDDGSPEPAIDVPRPEGLPALRIYRVLEDVPWHQHGARNLGAWEAQGSWLFMTDMDHALPAESLGRVLKLKRDDRHYVFERRDAPNLKPYKEHKNTFACTKALYWRVGGYDEDLTGYATDRYFLPRLNAAGARVSTDIVIVRYPREVVADASTTTLKRGSMTNHLANAAERERKRSGGLLPKVLAFKWERVL